MSREMDGYIASLYNDYCAAIESGVIDYILNCGEKYFCALHNGSMTEEDRNQLQEEVFTASSKE